MKVDLLKILNDTGVAFVNRTSGLTSTQTVTLSQLEKAFQQAFTQESEDTLQRLRKLYGWTD
jgi:hypothetical protein